jgi:glycosyltransferase involved in cell wall biosynthesis
MRIGIPMKSFDPAWGGPGTYTIELVTRMARADRENEYVLVYPADVQNRLHPESSWTMTNVLEIGTGRPRGLLWDQFTLPAICDREGIDIMFSPFMSIPIRGSYPKVFTIHGAERYVVPNMLPVDQSLKWHFMEKVLLGLADRLLVVSDTMARDFCAATGCNPEKVQSIHLGVSEDFHVIQDKAGLEQTRSAHGLPPEFLLFVGRIFPNKNFGNLLSAFAGIADRIPHNLVVAGGTRWKFEKDFRMVRQLGIEDRVMFLGFVGREDLIRIYNLATCLLYPSHYESFGLVQLEAMACGCPVVAADAGALREVAGEAAVYCSPNDPASIARATLALTDNPEFRAAQVARGLARARGYSWDRCAAETLALLHETARPALVSQVSRRQPVVQGGLERP